MVKRFGFIKNNKKTAMTLAALLVTMAVTCILLGMFVPILVQGMVNIASGKSFDGSVNLSRRNGYFLCYYDKDNNFTQTRVDVAPNGKDVKLTTTLAGDACKFDVPTWPDSFRVTLIGGGGAGSIGNFDMFDELIEGTSLTIKPVISGDVVTYDFNTNNANSSLAGTFLGKLNICLASGRSVRLDNPHICAREGTACSLSINTKEKSVSYTVAGEENTATLSGGLVYTSGDLTAIGSGSCPTTPKLFMSSPSLSFDIGKTISLSAHRSGLKVIASKGGNVGNKVENVVPFFNQNEQGQLVIPKANIGLGGRRTVSGGRGGATRLTLPGGTELVATGGTIGGVEEFKYYNEGANAISSKSYSGEDGEIDRFIPQPLQIITLGKGIGAIDELEDAGDATYSGAGGGSGAIKVNDYNTGVFNENPCLTQRVRMSVGGRAYELECTPKTRNNFVTTGKINDFMERTNSGNGAPGAILIAW